MKNILLLLFSIFSLLGISEMLLRDFILPKMQIHMSVPPTIFLDKGYFVNPNVGSARDQFGSHVAYYHYYPPHLRDTLVNPKAKHILVLGDSFTFGMLLPWKKTYIYHLQKDANKKFGENKYEFLNAGLGGWGTVGYLSYLEDYGARISPKFVLVFLNTDDIGRSMESNNYQLLDSASLRLKRIYHPCTRHPALREIITNPWIFSHSAVLQAMRFIITESYSRYHHVPGPDMMPFSIAGHYSVTTPKYKIQKFQNEAAILDSRQIVVPENKGRPFQDTYAIRYAEALFYRMNLWCKQHHAKLLVVTTGFNAFYSEHEHDPTKSFLKVAPSFFAKEHIAFYDTAKPFKKIVAGKQFQIPVDFHPNAFGAHAIAIASWPWIEKQLEN